MNFDYFVTDMETPAISSPARDFGVADRCSQTQTRVQVANTNSSIDDLLDLVSSSGPMSLPTRNPVVHTPFNRQGVDAIFPLPAGRCFASVNKKCARVTLGGSRMKRGHSSAFMTSCVCSNLRCIDCDFTVIQFQDRIWNKSADYMFFRENMPNERKLQAKLDEIFGFTAYACQCKWTSAGSEPVSIENNGTMARWTCAGHSG
uniref:Cilia- and flagella-associated protein 418 n=1 Tax=Albugo laibachii Nc14 TaxID=890382 RepID=F0VZV9_9STRA|nr:sporangia induced hypothetical protein [Albugo laibachii Nc14]|eukprot:CCA14330.1 sporangia induced hypothetical protein [Albugo laibachii Nc14]